MKKLNVEISYPPPSANQIKDFEDKFKIKLPSDYKSFLEEVNPFKVKDNKYVVGENEYYIHHIFPLSSDLELSLTQMNKILTDLFNNNYITFADDPGGYQFILSINPSDYGKVYFYRYDQEWGKALTLLANSFTEFINGLHPYEGQ
jgi:SMI1-KNR4 cell-wall